MKLELKQPLFFAVQTPVVCLSWPPGWGSLKGGRVETESCAHEYFVQVDGVVVIGA
jgi:hypothetical protein